MLAITVSGSENVPSPPGTTDQSPEVVNPETAPPRATVGLLAQTVAVPPPLTIIILSIVITRLSITALQRTLLVEVKYSVTVPAVVSSLET